MEQSHSASDVLSGLRKNPSALLSAGLSMEYSEWQALWMVTLVKIGPQLSGRGVGGVEESFCMVMGVWLKGQS